MQVSLHTKTSTSMQEFHDQPKFRTMKDQDNGHSSLTKIHNQTPQVRVLLVLHPETQCLPSPPPLQLPHS